MIEYGQEGAVMNQRLSKKSVAKIARRTGLDVIEVMVRSGTRNRKDLWLADGSIVYLWPDGSMEESKDRNGLQWMIG